MRYFPIQIRSLADAIPIEAIGGGDTLMEAVAFFNKCLKLKLQKHGKMRSLRCYTQKDTYHSSFPTDL